MPVQAQRRRDALQIRDAVLSSTVSSPRKSVGFAWLPVAACGELAGALDVAALQRVFARVARRHDALRARLSRVSSSQEGDCDESRTLVLFEAVPQPELVLERCASRLDARARAQAMHAAYDKDPYGARLFEARLFCCEHDAVHVLYLRANHCVADGWSHQLFYAQLVEAYNTDGESDDESDGGVRCADFLAQREALQRSRACERTPAVAQQRAAYALAERLPCSWPTVCAREDVTATLACSGALLRSSQLAQLSCDETRRVAHVLDSCKGACGGCSLPSALLAAYLYALDRLHTEEDCDHQKGLVQYSHSGRIGHSELSRVYGQLATDMNVLAPLGPADASLASVLARAHAAVLESLALANVPYALAYASARDAQQPLPPIFNWYDRYTQVPSWRAVEATEVPLDNAPLADKTFNTAALYLMGLVQADGSLFLKFFFNEQVYARDTVQRALDRIKVFLKRVAENDLPSPPPPKTQQYLREVLTTTTTTG